MNKEVWKDIPEYEGLYQVSNMGNVRSVSHLTSNNPNGGKRLTKGKILIPYKMPNGYMQVQFSKNKNRTKKYVHRLVAEAFLDNKQCFPEVNHINGDKEDNSINNLEWVTHRENQKHMVRHRLTKKAIPAICIETNTIYNSLSEAEKLTGYGRKSIKKSIDLGTEYKGFHWKQFTRAKNEMLNFEEDNT